MSGAYRQGGGVLRKRHTTVFRDAAEFIKLAWTAPKVTKVRDGEFFETGRTDKPRLKFFDIPGGVGTKVIAGGRMQLVYVYTGDPEMAKRFLTENWER